MFPDKEPTDHEIRGRQMFSITPPHVNSVGGKDRKNQSGVGVDNRQGTIFSKLTVKLNYKSYFIKFYLHKLLSIHFRLSKSNNLVHFFKLTPENM